MKKMYFFVIAILLGVVGCSTLKDLIQKPTVTFDSVSMKDMSLFDATAAFKFKVANPNSVGLKLQSLTYQMNIDGREFIKGDSQKEIALPAKGDQLVELPITINYLEFFGSITEFLKKQSLNYDLTGSFGIGLFKIPYSRKGTFTLPKLPQVSLKNASIQQLSFTGADLMLQLEMTNENAFAVALQNLDYTVKIGGIHMISGKSAGQVALTDQGHQVVNLPVHLNLLSLGQAAQQLLNQGAAAYEVSGTMGVDVPKMGIKRVPFSQSGNVDFRGN